MTSCLLFDCDGTLVDSERLCNLGLVIQFQHLGVTLDVDELVVRYRGWKLDRTLATIAGQYGLTLDDDFIPSYRAVVADLFESELQPIDGIVATLEQLPYPKAVVSSGPPPKIAQSLRLCGLADYFGDNIFSSYELGIWKPDPGIYQAAARAMGHDIAECAVVDDSLVGVEAGYRAGARTFFFNRFDEPCEFDEVVSFDDMTLLPELIRR
ncbi:HAD-IA family hydrolase [Gynuella sp.]|uniref:HAD-IA family hydrolase n=1 Tax=Gynuella sp. TaxID=2969146 RepID=UPI003D0B8C32